VIEEEEEEECLHACGNTLSSNFRTLEIALFPLKVQPRLHQSLGHVLSSPPPHPPTDQSETLREKTIGNSKPSVSECAHLHRIARTLEQRSRLRQITTITARVPHPSIHPSSKTDR
jgi:hypothetical protein